MPTITLYRGDNGVHEFYESEDGSICVIRNHGTDDWFVLKEEFAADRPSSGPLPSVLRDLSCRTGSRVAVDPSREFRLPCDREQRMQLVEVA